MEMLLGPVPQPSWPSCSLLPLCTWGLGSHPTAPAPCGVAAPGHPQQPRLVVYVNVGKSQGVGEDHLSYFQLEIRVRRLTDCSAMEGTGPVAVLGQLCEAKRAMEPESWQLEKKQEFYMKPPGF